MQDAAGRAMRCFSSSTQGSAHARACTEALCATACMTAAGPCGPGGGSSDEAFDEAASSQVAETHPEIFAAGVDLFHRPCSLFVRASLLQHLAFLFFHRSRCFQARSAREQECRTEPMAGRTNARHSCTTAKRHAAGGLPFHIDTTAGMSALALYNSLQCKRLSFYLFNR